MRVDRIAEEGLPKDAAPRGSGDSLPVGEDGVEVDGEGGEVVAQQDAEPGGHLLGDQRALDGFVGERGGGEGRLRGLEGRQGEERGAEGVEAGGGQRSRDGLRGGGEEWQEDVAEVEIALLVELEIHSLAEEGEDVTHLVHKMG